MSMHCPKEAIIGKRILFGHQSVGQGIVEGVRALAPRIRIVALDPAEPIFPANNEGELVHFLVGRNGDAGSKDASFAAVMERSSRVAGAIVMYKYCYADVSYETDVEEMFSEYLQHMQALQLRFPETTFVHITIPLTTTEMGWKAHLKSVLGHPTPRELCVKRNLFNNLLRQRCRGREPIFDLAEIESTRADGSRSCFQYHGHPVYTLAAEYTSDGAHLNPLGRSIAASRLLDTLADLCSATTRPEEH